AESVGRHEYWSLPDSNFWECACGVETSLKVEMDQHIASTIAAALRERYEIVELPDFDSLDHFEIKGNWVRQYAATGFGAHREFSLEEARPLAAALLAAAAEADQ
ncbi:MAG: hypothetical protein ACPGVG_16800, partial [Mycobacterium sp.]